MNKDNLVVLKGKTALVVEATGTRFEPNKHYRAIELDEKTILVFGEPFELDLFNNQFETVHDRMLREFEAMELLKDNGAPISKTAFVERLGLHIYGKGKRKLFIGFFGGKMNGMWGFYPNYAGDTKAQFLKDAYNNYKDVILGEVDLIDNELIQRGNSGIPLSFRDIYFRPEWKPNNEKREIYC